ncbi:unnamed protein product [Allacma fusca]|uniref:SIAH-type domain-containing protein n=1 Tax=Allacma fusca TaxID=39272 RepID=A0A8J2K462_9HEXA|nr:unnamed protein product [Allacma fusca]
MFWISEAYHLRSKEDCAPKTYPPTWSVSVNNYSWDKSIITYVHVLVTVPRSGICLEKLLIKTKYSCKNIWKRKNMEIKRRQEIPNTSFKTSFRVRGRWHPDVSINNFCNWRKRERNEGSTGNNRRYTIACFTVDDHEALEACYKLMECSFCKLICPPEDSMVCDHGHLTCNACKSRVVKCTFEDIDDHGVIRLCLTGLSSFKLVMYEYIYNALNVTFRCENWRKGCDIVLRSNEKRIHRTRCYYRPEIGCPFSDCEAGEMNCTELISHLNQHHETTLVTKNAKMVTLYFKPVPDGFKENYSWTPAVFSLSNYNFLLTILQTDGKVFILFYRLERKRSRDNLFIEMKIIGKDKKNNCFWKSVPRDFNVPQSTLKSGMWTKTLSTFMKDFVQTTDGKNSITLFSSVSEYLIRIILLDFHLSTCYSVSLKVIWDKA